eukprot:20183-Heterococcus_DN1.PRE.3
MRVQMDRKMFKLNAFRNSKRFAAAPTYHGIDDVHICKQLREAGCAWDTVACSRAVSACQLDTLRWLHENGCPWIFRSLCQDAARQGSIDIMAYLQQQSAGEDWND